MTTFKDFLKGGDAEELQKRCAIFLERSKGLPLYRGYRGYGGPLLHLLGKSQEVPIRKDRKPRDSSLFVHGLLDAYFQKKFGVKVRSEGMFVTGDSDTVYKYGKPHYVFPVGNFKFVWGTHNGDAVADTLWFSRQIENMMKVRKAEEAADVTKTVMDAIDWHTDNLDNAIKSGAEIAILADSAIIVPVGKTPYEKIIGG